MNESTVARYTYSPTLQEPAESGTYRIADAAPNDELRQARLALAEALVTIANAAAQLGAAR